MKIEIQNIEKKFKDVTPIKDLSVTINEGDVIAVIGPSGTGKSTLLRCINMLDPPTKGKIIFDGIDITDKKCNLNEIHRRIGMVFQSFNLFGHLTAVENIMLPLTELKKMSKHDAYEIAMEQLRLVGLTDKAFNYPDEISGGQKQRISIARTLAMNPEVILFDEPTSALDPTMVHEVEGVIRNLAKTGKTMMIVTHEMRLAKEISNRVFYLDKGTLYEEGTPEQIFENPVRERTKAFIKQIRVFLYKSSTDSFEYSDFISKFNKYASANDIPDYDIMTTRAYLYGFAAEFLPQYISTSVRFSLLVRYNQKQELSVVIYFKAIDGLKEKIYNELKQVFEGTASSSTEDIEDKDYDSKITFVI